AGRAAPTRSRGRVRQRGRPPRTPRPSPSHTGPAEPQGCTETCCPFPAGRGAPSPPDANTIGTVPTCATEAHGPVKGHHVYAPRTVDCQTPGGSGRPLRRGNRT